MIKAIKQEIPKDLGDLYPPPLCIIKRAPMKTPKNGAENYVIDTNKKTFSYFSPNTSCI
jgi:hypothetical protein